MSKPQFLSDGYGAEVTRDAERVLVTLLRGLGPWRNSIFLVSGLAPQYIVRRRPPDVPLHAGAGDVDVVISLDILADTDAYATLEEKLKRMNFSRYRACHPSPAYRDKDAPHQVGDGHCRRARCGGSATRCSACAGRRGRRR